jgi:hypothetical protein
LKKLIKELQDYSDILQNKPPLSPQLLSTHNNLRDDILQFEENYLCLAKEFNEKMLQGC